MKRLEQLWFGPVAAIRPYLFQRCFLLVIAFDLLVLMTERGSRYGLNGIPFNVPHFGWLDTVHRMILPGGVPTATYYCCTLYITSFFIFCLVLAGHRPWLLGLVTALYTYAWSMSRLDSYLHHYMLSLILGCMIFFPRIDARSLRNGWRKEIGDDEPQLNTKQSKSSRKRKRRTQQRASGSAPHLAARAAILLGLAVAYRAGLSQAVGLEPTQRWVLMFVFVALLGLCLSCWKVTAWNEVGPLVSGWAYRLLATTVGVIYIFTSIAKMDSEWCGGHTLRAVGTTESVLKPIEQIAATLGVTTEWFWSALATFVIPLELTLAACYLISVGQDVPGRKWLRRICACGFALAVGLHLNNEMMNLVIQWFGYYMLLLAMIILLPARVLMLLGLFFVWPESWLRDRYDRWLADLSRKQTTVAVGVTSAFAIAGTLFAGYNAWIAGAIVASFLISAGFALLIAYGLLARWDRGLKIAIVTLLSSVLMAFAVWQCSMRFDYFDLRGKTLQLLGDDEGAQRELQIASTLPAPTAKDASGLFTNLGIAYSRKGEINKAERMYRAAISEYPQEFLAHYNLANLLVKDERLSEAEKHYRGAIAIKNDFSDAMVNLGNVLEFENRTHEAIDFYQAAIAIEPNAPDIQQMLHAAQCKIGLRPPPKTDCMPEDQSKE